MFVSKLFIFNAAFAAVYLVTLIFTLATNDASGVVGVYASQLSMLRLPVNVFLLFCFVGAAVLRKQISGILLIIAMFNWLTLIDDYFVLQIQNISFESTLGTALASLRPLVVASLTLLSIEAMLYERRSDK
jgi:hypothetical protein